MSKKTICLNMIVKNESHIIRETLVNICKYVKLDYWVISDTGSSDNTIDIIKSFFKEKEIPGEIHVNTWENFGHNRSLGLELSYNKTDYVFMFDADDKICGNFKLPVLKSDKYFLTFKGNTINYKRALLVNNRKKWKFKGVLHEFLCSDEPIGENTIEGDYYIFSGRTGNRNKDVNKYKKDAEILEKAFNDKNTEADLLPRYSFYLSQSYKDSGDILNAIKWYTKTLGLNGWVQEKYHSCLMLGNLHLQQGNDKDALKFWLKTIEYDSERIEGIVKACEWGYTNSNHCLVNALYHRFHKYNHKPKDKLFLFYDLYNYHLEYYNSISSFYVNDKKSGYESCKNIILYNGYNLEHTFNNFIYYIDYFKKDKDELLVNKIKEYLINPTISHSKRMRIWNKLKDYLKKNKKIWKEIDKEINKHQSDKEWCKTLNLDNNFIKIVNLPRRADRKRKMKQTLENNNILSYNFVNAIDGQKLKKNSFLVEMFKGNNFSNRRGVIGCALSHYYIWKELIKDNDNDFYVILEDDIELCNNFSQQLKKIQCDLKNKDMVFLGYHMFEQKREQHREYNDSNIDLFIQKLNKELYIGGFFMYSINKSGARKMIKYIEENGMKQEIDNIILNPSIELYETVPQLSFSKWNENGVKIDTDIQHDYSYDSWLD